MLLIVIHGLKNKCSFMTLAVKLDRDNKNAIHGAKVEGIEIGKAEGIGIGLKKAAISMLKRNMAISLISELTGLPISEIESLRDKSHD